ncbi:MAG: peptidoglycan DD-metalloendopeptidase family protein [Bacteroidales bacterium]|nr:peptidoglycan DD-metalloendopeptidase family protein [Bacteroidales bacterium]
MCGKKYLTVFLFIQMILAAVPSVAQNIGSQKEKIKKIESDIKLLDSRINSTKDRHKRSLNDLLYIKKRISNRKELLLQLDKELDMENNAIAKNERQLLQLENRLDTLKEYYKKLITCAYKNRNTKLWALYIFASNDIAQGYRRWEYLRKFSDKIKDETVIIRNMQDTISARRSNLEKMRTGTVKMQEKKLREIARLSDEQKEAESYTAYLAGQERKYKRQLAGKKREASALNRQLQRMLKEAMAAKKPAGRNSAVSAADIRLAENFAQNKGKLPWPVDSGVIIESFGQHYHPVFKGVKLPFNNGINISSPLNGEVKCVFDGVVKQIILVPGYDRCILVQHGSYFTFYCKLGNVTVENGQKVSTGQVLGTLSEENGSSILHFELWKGVSKQNPESWLRKK